MAKKRLLTNYNALGSQSAEWVIKNLPFVLFLGFLATIYIANSRYAEKKMRSIIQMQTQVKELERKSNSVESEIMFHSRYSEVAKKVKEKGLGRRGTEPVKVKQ